MQITLTITADTLAELDSVVRKLASDPEPVHVKQPTFVHAEEATNPAFRKATEKPKEAEKAATEEPPAEAAKAAGNGAADTGEAFNPFAEEPKPAKKKKITRDEVQQAFNSYREAYGQASAITDVTAMLGKNFGIKRIADIPNDQEAFAKAIEMVKAAISNNEFGRERVNA
jgi:hypothetical protein